MSRLPNHFAVLCSTSVNSVVPFGPNVPFAGSERSVIDTGLVLTPRGVGVLIAMQVAGLLLRRGVDPRLMIGLGFAIGGVSMLEMSTWSLAALVDGELAAIFGVGQIGTLDPLLVGRAHVVYERGEKAGSAIL